MNQVEIVILNYKTWELTLDMITHIRSIRDFDICDILVVDNKSPNDSEIELRKDAVKRGYTIIETGENKGYAYGNNVGLRYAYKKGYKYAWILNNDIEITDNRVLEKMLYILEKNGKVAVVSPDIVMPDGHTCNRELVRPSFWQMTAGMIQYKKAGRQIRDDQGDGWCFGYRPQGCCMLVNLSIMDKIGYMDENTFLYYEEHILSEKLLTSGYKIGNCYSTSLLHNHSATVKSIYGLTGYLKLINKSYYYLCKYYRRFNTIQCWLCLIFLDMKESLLWYKRNIRRKGKYV